MIVTFEKEYLRDLYEKGKSDDNLPTALLKYAKLRRYSNLFPQEPVAPAASPSAA
jgi:hypothetical protein